MGNLVMLLVLVRASLFPDLDITFCYKQLQLPNLAFQHFEKNEISLASLGRDFYILLMVV